MLLGPVFGPNASGRWQRNRWMNQQGPKMAMAGLDEAPWLDEPAGLAEAAGLDEGCGFKL